MADKKWVFTIYSTDFKQRAIVSMVGAEQQEPRARERMGLPEELLETKARELSLDQEELQKSNRYLLGILDAMVQAVVVTDAEFVIRLVNTVALELFGWAREEIVGRAVTDLFPPTWFPMMKSKAGYDFFHGLYREELFPIAVDRKIPIGLTMSVLKNSSGDFEGMVCSLIDLTKRKVLERELLQAQKLESVGRLSAGVAHEINTPIQYVRDNTTFMRDQFAVLGPLLSAVDRLAQVDATSQPALLAELIALAKTCDLGYVAAEIPLALQQTLEGAESVARIVRSLKEFSHPGTEQKMAVALNRALESTMVVSKNEWKYVAEMEMNLDENIPTIAGYPGELNQTFLNLVVNAAHAIGDVTDHGRKGKGKITISSKKLDGKVEVRIGDSGGGIPDAIRGRIFDPFFTTKPVGRGTGQGLAIAYTTVVERHGGTINFESELGKGTTFIVTLPIAA